MAYKEVKIINGALVSTGLKKVPDTEVRRDKKVFARKKIEEEVFDIEDSVADNAKMISLLMSFVSRLYSIIPDEQKANLDVADKDLIEYTINKFAGTTTLSDYNLSTKGTEVVDNLMLNQEKIKKIVVGN